MKNLTLALLAINLLNTAYGNDEHVGIKIQEYEKKASAFFSMFNQAYKASSLDIRGINPDDQMPCEVNILSQNSKSLQFVSIAVSNGKIDGTNEMTIWPSGNQKSEVWYDDFDSFSRMEIIDTSKNVEINLKIAKQDNFPRILSNASKAITVSFNITNFKSGLPNIKCVVAVTQQSN